MRYIKTQNTSHTMASFSTFCVLRVALGLRSLCSFAFFLAVIHGSLGSRGNSYRCASLRFPEKLRHLEGMKLLSRCSLNSQEITLLRRSFSFDSSWSGGLSGLGDREGSSHSNVLMEINHNLCSCQFCLFVFRAVLNIYQCYYCKICIAGINDMPILNLVTIWTPHCPTSPQLLSMKVGKMLKLKESVVIVTMAEENERSEENVDLSQLIQLDATYDHVNHIISTNS